MTIMINGSKISIHRFIATTLFRLVKEWPHSSGNIHDLYIYIYIYISNNFKMQFSSVTYCYFSNFLLLFSINHIE